MSINRGEARKTIMKSTKNIVTKQGTIQKKTNTPRIGATMAKRRDPKSPSNEDKTSRKIDAYLIGNTDKVGMRLTLKPITKIPPN